MYLRRHFFALVRCVYACVGACVCVCVCGKCVGVEEFIVMVSLYMHIVCVRACALLFFFQGFIIKPLRHNGERNRVGSFGPASEPSFGAKLWSQALEPKVKYKHGLA